MMDSLKRWGAGALALGVAVQLSGCLFVADDGDDLGPLPLGTLTVNWSIDGLRDPLDCEDFDVDRLELVIYDDSSGDVVDELEPFCEAFGISVDLPEGYYSADVTMVDSFDRSATLTETLEAIDVIGNTDLTLSVDFPVDSFL